MSSLLSGARVFALSPQWQACLLENISLVYTTGRLQARKEGNGTNEVLLSLFDDGPLKSVLV
jgi:hypothetical protein